METHLQRPLHWLICLLHFNELPFRHLFQSLDGKTSGPGAFTGPIGKTLKNSINLSVIKYKPIRITLPKLPDDISTDQKYSHEICNAISKGKCPQSLALKHPGNICHSRWLTLANNILRTYVGTANPSKNLVTLTNYIMKVYAPGWFQIKINPRCYNGAANFFFIMNSSRYLNLHLRKIIDPVFERNAYFAHAENIILCMLNDSDRQTRNLAVARILAARQKVQQKKIRIFKVPRINVNAKRYVDMINWEEVEISEPPLLSLIPENELREIAATGELPIKLKLSCHTQSVERCVKVYVLHQLPSTKTDVYSLFSW